MPHNEKKWLSLTQASAHLGVHPTTLRRWVDAGSIPCFRTPGGHRRFKPADLDAWVQGEQTTALIPPPETFVQNAVGLTRQAMAEKHVSGESWYLAFEQEEDRQRMRDTGRRLFGLATQYVVRAQNKEAVLQQGRRIGELFGEQCSQHGIALVDTVHAFTFFRQSLLRATRPGLVNPGQYDGEDVRIHRQLRHFLDEVMYACLARYETTCRALLLGAGGETRA